MARSLHYSTACCNSLFPDLPHRETELETPGRGMLGTNIRIKEEKLGGRGRDERWKGIRGWTLRDSGGGGDKTKKSGWRVLSKMKRVIQKRKDEKVLKDREHTQVDKRVNRGRLWVQICTLPNFSFSCIKVWHVQSPANGPNAACVQISRLLFIKSMIFGPQHFLKTICKKICFSHCKPLATFLCDSSATLFSSTAKK